MKSLMRRKRKKESKSEIKLVHSASFTRGPMPYRHWLIDMHERLTQNPPYEYIKIPMEKATIDLSDASS